MCGFCGLVGGAEHWSDLQVRPDVSGDASNQGSRQRERLHRTALLNRITRHYGVQVQDWAGSSWILSHVTGETEVIDRLAEKFHEAPRGRIEQTVHEQQEALAHNRVRDYVPVLIEHAAKDRLRGTVTA